MLVRVISWPLMLINIELRLSYMNTMKGCYLSHVHNLSLRCNLMTHHRWMTYVYSSHRTVEIKHDTSPKE